MKLKLKDLQRIGGSRWTRGSMDRVYFPIAHLWRLHLKLGTCSVAREIRKILDQEMTIFESESFWEGFSTAKFWYDLHKKDFKIKLECRCKKYSELKMLLEMLSVKIVISHLEAGIPLDR